MAGDVVSLAAEMTPCVSMAVGAYGGPVLVRVSQQVWVRRDTYTAGRDQTIVNYWRAGE
jgi:hypothetical protein